MTLSGANLIAGIPSSEGSARANARNPITGVALLPPFHNATRAEIDRAVAQAKSAFRQNRTKTGIEKAVLLEEIATQIEDLGDELIHRVMEETGLPEGRVRGERGRTTGQLKLFATLLREGSWLDARIDTALPDRAPIPKPDLRNMQIPIGPVAVFGASNFPLAFSVGGGDTASALAAGCPVVCKAHPAHPGTSEMVGTAIAKAVAKTGFHRGTFSLLHGAGADTGQTLVTHHGISAVGFTGSFAAGKAIYTAAANRPSPIPVFAEMGSVNPVFVLGGAMVERGRAIGEGLAGSVTLGSGQFCTKPGLVFAEQGDGLDEFLGGLRDATEAVQTQTMLYAGILLGYEKGVDRVEDTPGVDRFASGNSATANDAHTSAQATVFVTDTEIFESNPHLREEVFGPATIVVKCKNAAEMESLARNLQGNLTGTIHGTRTDLEAAVSLARTIESSVGRVVINGFPTGVEVCGAMNHGGPFPATTAPGSTSVGTGAIRRFTRPICYQNYPQSLLPEELKDENPLGILRLVDESYTRAGL